MTRLIALGIAFMPITQIMSFWLIMAVVAPVSADTAAAEPPTIQALDEQRYRIGAIEVDKNQQRFTVPGVVIRLEPPLEFVAVTKGGYKNYESLLELDTNAIAFNLACILIGLDAKKAVAPRYHFDPESTQGMPVEVWVSWRSEDKDVQIKATDLFQEGGQPVGEHEWVYTGSVFMADGRYAAEMVGTLIGFVHDPESIIQHRRGLGLGKYGSVAINPAVAPPVGTRVEVSVRRSN